MIGLAGAHRTGKTTTARALARAVDLPFVKTDLSEVFQKTGLDPATPMDLATRMMIQNLILKSCIGKWRGYTAGFVSDRTPIDLIGYTIADIQGDTSGGLDAVILDYIDRCVDAANRYFGLIVLVQPGIPIAHAPGKAAPSPAYMEHLNLCMSGVMMRRDFEPVSAILRRGNLDLNNRVESVVTLYKRILKEELQQCSEVAQLH